MNAFFTTFFNQVGFLSADAPARVALTTRFFLGKPYLVSPQGEGINADIDTAPLYRFDGFDCVTYVNNVLAFAFANDKESFLYHLLRLNYYHQTPTFQNRFHFMSADWNPCNQQNHYVCDITENIVDDNNQRIVLFAIGEIDRVGWFLKKAQSLENATPDGAKRLTAIAKTMHNAVATLPYLPLSALFDAQKNPREVVFAQIPHASVIEIVRPNWNLKEKIGTNLHVSHVGFAIRLDSGELVFRHTSSEQKCVAEISLTDYLKPYLDGSTIKGINVQVIAARELQEVIDCKTIPNSCNCITEK